MTASSPARTPSREGRGPPTAAWPPRSSRRSRPAWPAYARAAARAACGSHHDRPGARDRRAADTVSDAVQRQLDGLSAGFRESTADVAGIWARALDGQQRANETAGERPARLAGSVRLHLRAAFRADGRHVRMEASAGKLSDVWDGALSRQERAGESWLATTSRPWPPPPPGAPIGRAGAGREPVPRRPASRADGARRAAPGRLERIAGFGLGLAAPGMGTGGGADRRRQQEICDALALTAQHLRPHQLQAGETIAEISRLVQAAADAPGRRRLQAELAARPGSPAGLDGLAGEHDRRAAPGMAAGWRRGGQPPARDLRRAVARRAEHLRAGAHPEPRRPRSTRLVDAAADAPRPPSRCRTGRATASAWTPGAARWPR